MTNISYQHTPVLAKEVVEYLTPAPGKTLVDCTLGGGGHVALLNSPHPAPIPSGHPSPFHGEGKGPISDEGSLLHFVEKGIKGMRLIGFDQDLEAIAAAKQRLVNFDNIEYIHDNFSNLKKHLKEKVDGFLFDLGVSSYQIDAGERGFSLQKDGPLDMRMDQTQKITAADIINSYSAEELVKIFYEYGEERFARRISNSICLRRPPAGRAGNANKIKSTLELKEIIEKAIPTWKKRESVTRIFQALRIAVNNELESLEKALKDAIDLLNPGGRIVVISYHSLEDRIVKNTFRDFHKNDILKVLTKKPVTAGDEEIAENPRARSAKLRAAEKL